MRFKPTIFEVEIAGEKYRFGALTQKEMERWVAKETDAGEQVVDSDPLPDAPRSEADVKARVQAKQAAAKLTVRYEMVASALSKAGEPITGDELGEECPAPVFTTLFIGIMQAHGMKLDASKLGEVKASVNS